MTLLYGQIDPLHGAVRVRAPMVDAACCDRGDLAEADAPPLFLRVSYGANGPWRVVWDNQVDTYRWDSGPDAGARLGQDVDQAADQIAWALGAPVGPDSSGRG